MSVTEYLEAWGVAFSGISLERVKTPASSSPISGKLWSPTPRLPQSPRQSLGCGPFCLCTSNAAQVR